MMAIIGRVGASAEVVRVALSDDHLKSLAGSSVQKAIHELIWNGLDADAKEVRVEFERGGSLDGTTGLRIIDNGHGMTHDEARQHFGMLGDSWKKESGRSLSLKRILHGKNGHGRFRAYALGNVTWTTLARADSSRPEVQISGSRDTPGDFHIRTERTRDAEVPSGTIVTVTNVDAGIDQLLTDDAFERLCGEFGPYLRKYPGVSIIIDGRELDASNLIVGAQETRLEKVPLTDGKTVDIDVEVLEWAPSVSQRVIYLCDADGFSLYSLPSGLTHFGINYSVHARAGYFKEIMKIDGFALAEMDADVQAAIAAIKGEARKYLRARHAEERKGRVDEWKKEAVYPYSGEPASAQEVAERQVFDIVAANVVEFVPEFDRSGVASKRLQFKLLQQALQTNPAALGIILAEVIGLPKERQDELAELLQHSRLSDLIHAARTVADRLSFLHLLNSLVYDDDSKEKLLERAQLHRIVASQTWLFGERYNLVVDDQSLTEVLRKHFGKNKSEYDVLGSDEVLRADGSRGIVDLVLGRALRGHGDARQENLVIELKRPKQPINMAAIEQLDSYAHAISINPRFSAKNHKWTFIAVSTRMDDRARDRANQPNSPPGYLHTGGQGRYTLWAKTWAEIMEEARAGLDFVNGHLAFTATDETAAKLLNAQYSKYFVETGVPAERLRKAGAGEEGEASATAANG